MSYTTEVLVPNGSMPSPDKWADAIRAAGFDLELYRDFEVGAHSGFLPCTYKGLPSGFELFFEAGGAVSFVTHSDMSEAISAAIAAGVLCEMTGGKLIDNGDEPPIEATAAVTWARNTEAECLTADAEPVPKPSPPWWKFWG